MRRPRPRPHHRRDADDPIGDRSSHPSSPAGPAVTKDALVAELAGRQCGVVTTSDLRACGLSPKAISHRVSQGRLHRLSRGVYAVGDLALPALAPMVAALAACGPHAVLSHWTAAWLW